MTKAFLAVNGGQGAASARVRELVARLTEQVVGALHAPPAAAAAPSISRTSRTRSSSP